MTTRRDTWGRREFLGGLTGAAGLLSLGRRAEAEPPPETTTLRMAQAPVSICQAPMYVAELFLLAEGFTGVQYVNKQGIVEAYKALASGESAIGFGFGVSLIMRMDTGDPIVILAGGQVGCFELFGTDRVRAIRDRRSPRSSGAAPFWRPGGPRWACPPSRGDVAGHGRHLAPHRASSRRRAVLRCR